MQCPFCEAESRDESVFGLHIWMRHMPGSDVPGLHVTFARFGFGVYEAFRKHGIEGARQVVMAYEIGGWS